MSTLKKIAVNIIEKRNEKEYSQEKLAFKADIDRSNLAKIELGDRNFKISTLLKIAEALEVDAKILLE